jgi:hypothetical protein
MTEQQQRELLESIAGARSMLDHIEERLLDCDPSFTQYIAQVVSIALPSVTERILDLFLQK